MTLLQRDRENIELGREEGTISATKIIKLYNKGMDNERRPFQVLCKLKN